MAYRSITQTDLKKHRLFTLYSKLPTEACEIYEHVDGFLNSDVQNGRKKTLENIDLILNVARQSFKTSNFVVNVNDACCHYNVYETFLDIRSGTIDYLEAYKMAFDYSILLYMKSVKDLSIIDGATFAILSRRNQLMEFELEENTNDFDKMLRAMLAEIDGTDGKVNVQMSEVVCRDDYLLYLLMPRLDYRVTSKHRAIYDAFVTGDSAALEAILDAV